MTHIVLVIDDDEERARTAAEQVTDLDWDTDALDVTVLHVFTDNVEGATISQFGPAREARDVLEAAGVDVTLAETSGDPADKIVTYAADEDADVICLSGRKRSPAGKAVFGSVSQSVMLNSDRPVLFCPSE